MLLPLNVNLQRLAVVALALAGLAGDVDVGQEVHLDLDDAVALAGLAAAALDVEAEAAGLVAAGLGLGEAGEPVADRAEGAGVGGGVGARGAADRRLVDVDDLVEMLEALDRLAGRRGLARAVQPHRGGLEQGLDGQRRLAAAGDAGDAGEGAEREGGGRRPRRLLPVALTTRARACRCPCAARRGIGIAPLRRSGTGR